MERSINVDAVRGFALLGIFVVNVTFMASAYPGNLTVDPRFGSALDEAVRLLSSVLVDMKFYVLFSFLFGYSFTLQMRAGDGFTARMLRRIAGLFVIGALHTVFLYGGDVLTTYAIACLILLLMRRVRDVTAIRVAAGIYAFVLLSMVISGLLVDASAWLPDPAVATAETARMATGGWGAHIAHNIGGLWLLLLNAASVQGPTALAMFLLGMVAGRRGLLSRVRGDEPVLRRIQWIGFPAGLAGGLIYALGGGNGSGLAAAASVATAPLLTAAYVATLLRIIRRWGAVRQVLAPAGRMALTNYLGQSVVGLLVFTGVGLGLAGTFSPGALMLLVAVVFAGQSAASALWLHHFRYGPAEWILRWLTNARRPALAGAA
ncbi:DUF418 domain-containing protein [Catenuloplanes japonicus]|uniref:DUF418 domain-containing protein n=1 Tax=Catenuloplanes japonicus TaxID=33876 RepID=UPI000524713D|nr:DUF418 domain-containing protein [Catenuloplanes japonicus]